MHTFHEYTIILTTKENFQLDEYYYKNLQELNIPNFFLKYFSKKLSKIP